MKKKEEEKAIGIVPLLGCRCRCGHEWLPHGNNEPGGFERRSCLFYARGCNDDGWRSRNFAWRPRSVARNRGGQSATAGRQFTQCAAAHGPRFPRSAPPRTALKR